MGEDVFTTMSGIGWSTGPIYVSLRLINFDWNDTIEGDTETRRNEDAGITDGGWDDAVTR